MRSRVFLSSRKRRGGNNWARNVRVVTRRTNASAICSRNRSFRRIEHVGGRRRSGTRSSTSSGRFAAHGWTALGWPVEIGGKGLDVEERVASATWCSLTRRATVGLGLRREERRTHDRSLGHRERERSPERHSHCRRALVSGFSERDNGSDLAGLGSAPTSTATTSSSTGRRSGSRSACTQRIACCSLEQTAR